MEWLATLTLKWVLVLVGVLVLARTLLARFVRLAAARELVDAGLVAAVAVFLIVLPFVAQAYFIPTHSMHPTLRRSDRILVNKLAYRLGRPARGDVAVFRPPAELEDETEYLKRIIGLPGDLVEVQPPTLLVDGRPLLRLTRRPASEVAERNYGREPVGFTFDMGRGSARVDADAATITGGLNGDLKVRLLRPGDRVRARQGAVYLNDQQVLDVILGVVDESAELGRWGGDPTLTGRVFTVNHEPRLIAVRGSRLELREGHVRVNGAPLDEPYVANPPDYPLPPLRVPAGCYFMLGDNRSESLDSHAWGPLPQARLIGRADLVFWPPDRFGPVRWK